jgi:phage terminase small subunit
MGTPRKHPIVKKLEGNPGRRPIVEVQVNPAGEVFIPDHLNEDAQACLELLRRYMPLKVYASSDSFALAAFATAWAWHKRATFETQAPDFDPIEEANGRTQPHAWFKILFRASEDMRAWGARLGLDPIARAAMKMPKEDAPRSKFEGLLGHNRSSDFSNA